MESDISSDTTVTYLSKKEHVTTKTCFFFFRKVFKCAPAMKITTVCSKCEDE